MYDMNCTHCGSFNRKSWLNFTGPNRGEKDEWKGIRDRLVGAYMSSSGGLKYARVTGGSLAVFLDVHVSYTRSSAVHLTSCLVSSHHVETI